MPLLLSFSKVCLIRTHSTHIKHACYASILLCVMSEHSRRTLFSGSGELQGYYLVKYKKDLLRQVNPSPVNPLLHVQVKEPSVSVHVAFMWQGLLGHSLISEIVQPCIIFIQNF